ncbi:MAG TPA: RidA family protein [Chloroflexota bacterium]|nr:RidA family protein [Chloroflexota bacterium]
MVERRTVSSGSKWEPVVGYSRAVRVGNIISVSGTVGTAADGSIPSDAYSQARNALEIIRRALEEVGARLEDVVRTRMFVTDIRRFDEIARAHCEVFGAIRPATTMVEVTRLVDPAYLIEIEADAVV